MRSSSARRIAVISSLVFASLLNSGCGGGGGADGSSSDGRSAPRYDLSGTVEGLEEGPIKISIGFDTLVLQASLNTDGSAKPVPFKFRLPANVQYDLMIDAESLKSAGMNCEVKGSKSSGTMPAAPVSDLVIGCGRVKSLRLVAGRIPLDAGRDGPVSQSGFARPDAVAVDKSGNLYVSDQNAIRKISPAGFVSTFAGKANERGAIDGSGNTARFADPQGLGVDKDGNVYVADSGNGLIRRITPEGLVTTLAGGGKEGESGPDGFGAKAWFHNPRSLTVTPNGVVYVIDGQGATVRKIQPSGEVTTLKRAGGENISFSPETVITVDLAGGLYAMDTSGSYIWHRTEAGNETNFSYTRDTDWLANEYGAIPADLGSGGGGLAPSPTGGVYFSNYDGGIIRHMSDSGEVTFIAGHVALRGLKDGIGVDALFSGVKALAIDGQGNLYASESRNQAIRLITPAGKVTTYAGTVTTGSEDGLRSAASFNMPAGMGLSADGNLYVADRSNHIIRKITPEGVVTTLAGSPGYHGVKDGQGADAEFNQPTGLTLDATGDILVTDAGYCSLRRITPAGLVSTVVRGSCGMPPLDGPADTARLMAPTHLTADKDGNIYLIESDPLHGQAVRRVAKNGSVVTLTIPSLPTLRGIVAGPDGMLYVTTARTVLRMTPTGSTVVIAGKETESGTLDGKGDQARFDSLKGIAADANGNLIVADGSRLRMLLRAQDNTYAVSSLAGVIGSESIDLGVLPKSIGQPISLAVTPKKVYFTSNNAILSVDR